MKPIKGQHESGFKIFGFQRQSRKKFGGKKQKKTAFCRVLNKKKMNPHKRVGGWRKKKKKAPSSLIKGKHLSLWAWLLNRQLTFLFPLPPKKKTKKTVPHFFYMWRAQREEEGVIPLSCKPPLPSLLPPSPSLSRLPSSWRWPQRLAPAAARMCSCGLSQRLSEAPIVGTNERHSSDLVSTSSCSFTLDFLFAHKQESK